MGDSEVVRSDGGRVSECYATFTWKAARLAGYMADATVDEDG